MRTILTLSMAAAITCGWVMPVSADQFGSGPNAFSIDFVPIKGDARSVNGVRIGQRKVFADPAADFRMGVHEINQTQWAAFKASLGVPLTGNPTYAYGESIYHVGPSMPANEITWYEAAQFVNWLNTSTGHAPAYRFVGTQGTSDYTLSTWGTDQADNGTNLYRHKDAVYYLPTEDEWVKAAYWNGTNLQTYATKPGESLHQGDGASGFGWNYYENGDALDPRGPWAVGCGSEELNGTYDMMGNAMEWMESPYYDGHYPADFLRAQRGGSYNVRHASLSSGFRFGTDLYGEQALFLMGFRVAADVPEPTTGSILMLSGLAALTGHGRRRIRL